VLGARRTASFSWHQLQQTTDECATACWLVRLNHQAPPQFQPNRRGCMMLLARCSSAGSFDPDYFFSFEDRLRARGTQATIVVPAATAPTRAADH
jgi:hypothetical protein